MRDLERRPSAKSLRLKSQAYHDAPSARHGELGTVRGTRGTISNTPKPQAVFLRVDGLSDGTDLVNLEQQTCNALSVTAQDQSFERTVASSLLNSSLDALNVGDSQIITDNLNTSSVGEVNPSFPVILVEGVFDRDDAVLLDQANVDVCELFAGQPFRFVRVWVLEV